VPVAARRAGRHDRGVPVPGAAAEVLDDDGRAGRRGRHRAARGDQLGDDVTQPAGCPGARVGGDDVERLDHVGRVVAGIDGGADRGADLPRAPAGSAGAQRRSAAHRGVERFPRHLVQG
jgi:hypothetical protein